MERNRWGNILRSSSITANTTVVSFWPLHVWMANPTDHAHLKIKGGTGEVSDARSVLHVGCVRACTYSWVSAKRRWHHLCFLQRKEKWGSVCSGGGAAPHTDKCREGGAGWGRKNTITETWHQKNSPHPIFENCLCEYFHTQAKLRE